MPCCRIVFNPMLYMYLTMKLFKNKLFKLACVDPEGRTGGPDTPPPPPPPPPTGK